MLHSAWRVRIRAADSDFLAFDFLVAFDFEDGIAYKEDDDDGC